MKSIVTVLFLLLIGIAASAWAQGGSAEKGKALVESKKCALCHKAPEPGKPVLGKPMEVIAAGKDRRFPQGGDHRPQESHRPQSKNAGIQVNRCRTAGRYRVS